ncbi:MAG: hypothetical protein EBT51_11295 [Flavobacteriaceae bacterium]|nr:hypothetical protein [Flavobacteriaceae bacterium]
MRILKMNYKKWSQQELLFIQENYKLSDKDIAAELSRITGSIVTDAMIRRQRRKIGITKNRGRKPKK